MKLITLNGKAGFKKLRFLPFNRPFGVRKDLIEKINTYGFISPIKVIITDLITGAEELFVVDGQHRAAAANFLDITFYAEIIDLKFKSASEIVQFVASLNSTQVNWTTISYVNAYVYLGYPEYIKLNKYTKRGPYSISAVASMLNGIRTKGATPHSVKEGTFVASLTKEFEYTLEVSAKASKFARLTNRMGLGIHYVANLKSFNEEKFLKNFEKHYEYVRDLGLDDFTDIFMSWI